MPANAGTTWQLEPQKNSNRIYPKHPKGLGKVRFISVRDRNNGRHDMAAGASPRDEFIPKSSRNRSLRLFVPVAMPCPAPSC